MVTKDKINQIRHTLYMDAVKFSKKVAPAYKALNWRWSNGDKKCFVPKEKDIRLALIDLIGSLKKYTTQAETGGLRVGYEVNGNEIEAYLTFRIQERSYI